MSRLLDALQRPFFAFFDALFPRACVACGRLVPDRDEARPESASPHRTTPRDWCDRCLEIAQAFDARCVVPPDTGRASLLAAPLIYDGPIRDWILRIKVGGDAALARGLGGWLGDRTGHELDGGLGQRDSRRTWIVVPVPSTRARIRARGLDLTERLAIEVGRAAGIPMRRAIDRRGKGAAQKRAGRAARRRVNVAGAFVPRRRGREHVAGRTVLLADDVITTGNTIRSCARVLQHAGAGPVFAVALAVTPLDPTDSSRSPADRSA